MQNAISVKNGVIPSDTPTNKKAKKQLINISLKSFKPKDTVLVPVLTPVLPAPVPVDEVVTPPPSTPSRQDSASAKSRTPGLLLDNYEDETEEKPTLIFPTANAFTHDVQPSAAQQHAALFDNSGSEVFNKNEPSKVTYIPKETNLMAPGSEQNQQFHLWVLDEKQQKFLGDCNINKPFLTFGSSSAACHVIDRAVSVYSTHAALCFLDNKHRVLHSAGGNIRMWLSFNTQKVVEEAIETVSFFGFRPIAAHHAPPHTSTLHSHTLHNARAVFLSTHISSYFYTIVQ
eukprot:Platyproteum_vivax@DN7619_c0_g1_i1.p1